MRGRAWGKPLDFSGAEYGSEATRVRGFYRFRAMTYLPELNFNSPRMFPLTVLFELLFDLAHRDVSAFRHVERLVALGALPRNRRTVQVLGND